MMRILFVAPYGGFGGSENVLINVLERLDRARFSPQVLLLEQGPLEGRIQQLGIPTLVQHMPGKAGVAKFLTSARRVPGPIDVIHANGGKAAVYGLALRRHLQAPMVWMKHDYSHSGRPTNFRLRLRDEFVGFGLFRLQLGADVFTNVHVGDINRTDFKRRVAVDRLV